MKLFSKDILGSCVVKALSEHVVDKADAGAASSFSDRNCFAIVDFVCDPA